MHFVWPTKESADSAANPGADYKVRVQASAEQANAKLFCGCSGAVVCCFINNLRPQLVFAVLQSPVRTLGAL